MSSVVIVPRATTVCSPWATYGCSTRLAMRLESVVAMMLARLTMVWSVITAVMVRLVTSAIMLVAALVVWRRWAWSIVTDANTKWWHVDA